MGLLGWFGLVWVGLVGLVGWVTWSRLVGCLLRLVGLGMYFLSECPFDQDSQSSWPREGSEDFLPGKSEPSCD